MSPLCGGSLNNGDALTPADACDNEVDEDGDLCRVCSGDARDEWLADLLDDIRRGY